MLTAHTLLKPAAAGSNRSAPQLNRGVLSSTTSKRVSGETVIASTAGPPTMDEAGKALLASIHSDGCGVEVRDVLHRTALRFLRTPRPVSRGLSETNRENLVRSGAFSAEQLAATEARVARGALREEEARTLLETIAASLAASEVASLLKLRVEEVAQRREEGELYGFDAEGFTLYPKWQFTRGEQGSPLPGLPRLIDALVGDWHPASVCGFMTSPQEGLQHRGTSQTPIEWILHGGDLSQIELLLEGVRSR